MLQQIARIFGTAAGVLALLLLAACGGGGGYSGSPGMAPEAAPLSVGGLEEVTLRLGVVRTPIPITGGIPPYTVTSSNEAFVTAVINADNHLELTAVGNGNSSVAVQDRWGNAVVLLVRVPQVPLAVSSSSLTLPINIPATVTLTGGQPPYRVLGGIPAALSVTPVRGVTNEFQIMGNQVLDRFDIVFSDAANQTLSTSVTITAATTGVRLSPSALTISELGTNSTQPIRLTVLGAVGQFTVSSSHINLLRPAVVTHPAGTTAFEVVTGLNNNRCIDRPFIEVTITVVDSTPVVATSVITIQNSALACP